MNHSILSSTFRIITFCLFLGSTSAFALDPIYTGGFSNNAIKGYDTVAYFTEDKPVKGKAEHSTEHLGATWLFSSDEHLQLFITDPEKYMPQYGGYCAYAVSRNTTASIKPELFHIYDGKLYLNYSKGVQRRWLKGTKKRIKSANNNWPQLLN